MKRPKVCILRTAGTNCDKETAFAFKKAGSIAQLVHINALIRGQDRLDNYQILAIPGGFSYGDDVAAGKILANELRSKLTEDIRGFISGGKLIIGICNGFQVLVKAGLLPGNKEFRQEASLIINDAGKFEDRWVFLKSVKRKAQSVKCVWAKGLPEIIYLPVAHGEGKFIMQDKDALRKLEENRQVVFQYCDDKGDLAGYPHNPNGAVRNIAGICDDTGRILGLMPHPERHIDCLQQARGSGIASKRSGDGLNIFINGVEYARRHL